MTEFDRNTIGDATRMMKIMLPFLPPENQRSIACMIRITELFMTMDYFRNNYLVAPKDGMMSELKKNCTAQERQNLDMMEAFIKFRNMKNSMEGFMDNDQLSKFKKYQSILNGFEI